jgi:hypothetical protein
MSKVNFYVNSKNRKSDETPSNFSVIIPDGLLRVNKDEYFTLSVNSFIVITISTNSTALILKLV